MVSRKIFLMQKLQVTKLQHKRDPTRHTGEIHTNQSAKVHFEDIEGKKINRKLSKERKKQTPLWGLLLLRMNRKEN
jgi:hypothetical protein